MGLLFSLYREKSEAEPLLSRVQSHFSGLTSEKMSFTSEKKRVTSEKRSMTSENKKPDILIGMSGTKS